jgi:uncharacterized protein YndB with AHSA1/START domain
MAEIVVRAERRMPAPPARVYECIRNYREHHPRFLPPAFSNLRVEEGGIGAGTVFSFDMSVAGRKRRGRMRVAEPEPGRVLTESDLGSTLVTHFYVLPDGTGSRVRFETRWQGAKGIGGFFERLFAPRVLARVYKDELERLDRYSRSLPA